MLCSLMEKNSFEYKPCEDSHSIPKGYILRKLPAYTSYLSMYMMCAAAVAHAGPEVTLEDLLLVSISVIPHIFTKARDLAIARREGLLNHISHHMTDSVTNAEQLALTLSSAELDDIMLKFIGKERVHTQEDIKTENFLNIKAIEPYDKPTKPLRHEPIIDPTCTNLEYMLVSSMAILSGVSLGLSYGLMCATMGICGLVYDSKTSFDRKTQKLLWMAKVIQEEGVDVLQEKLEKRYLPKEFLDKTAKGIQTCFKKSKSICGEAGRILHLRKTQAPGR